MPRQRGAGHGALLREVCQLLSLNETEKRKAQPFAQRFRSRAAVFRKDRAESGSQLLESEAELNPDPCRVSR